MEPAQHCAHLPAARATPINSAILSVNGNVSRPKSFPRNATVTTAGAESRNPAEVGLPGYQGDALVASDVLATSAHEADNAQTYEHQRVDFRLRNCRHHHATAHFEVVLT